MFRSRAEKKVADAGYDPARLPPGQYLTEKWPVLHAGTVPKVDLATWDFRVWGGVENPIQLSWDELKQLPSTRGHRGHPLRHALEPVRHELPRRALARPGRARPAEPVRPVRRRARRAGLHSNLPLETIEAEDA